jgi:hypothetical protein
MLWWLWAVLVMFEEVGVVVRGTWLEMLLRCYERWLRQTDRELGGSVTG